MIIQKYLKPAQILLLLAGTIFAWSTVVKNFARFYGFEHTLFKIQNCTIPNPVTTPCFYGALGFLLALVWASLIYGLRDEHRLLRHQKRLMWFLYAATLFGWGNVAYEIYRYLQNGSKFLIGCSAQVLNSPFQSACFYGSSIYLLTLIVTIAIVWLLKKPETST